ncbi:MULTISPECIES: S8 family peptidase [Alcaligenaceae]|nr:MULTISPECIES: S8 family peptidase [Alcaligenaceae]
MAENNEQRRRHLFPTQTRNAERFTSPSSGGRTAAAPHRDRATHGPALMAQLQTVREAEQALAPVFDDADLETGIGLNIEFASFADAELLAASLADSRQGIELSNVRQQNDGVTLATAWVPQGKLTFFEKKIQAYIEERRSDDGLRALDSRPLIDAIQNIRVAAFEALWTDDPELLPASADLAVWWEVWLSRSPRRTALLDDFRRVAQAAGVQVSRSSVTFPERIVVRVHATRNQLQQPVLLSLMAEIRRARDTAAFFDEMNVADQAEWVESLAARIVVPDDDAPVVCLLDTGLTRAHPLLAQSVLEDTGTLTVNPGWGTADNAGHGTELAGLALYGDLVQALGHDEPVTLTHRLESVKLLHADHGNEDKDFGSLTIDAVAQPEARAPDLRRVFCLAISSEQGRDRGRPSAWSAAVDSLASDWINDGQTRRLFCIAAGNIQPTEAWAGYPGSFARPEYGIEAPGQAWNALTVGAYTDKLQIEEQDAQHYQPIAPRGCLSPFSSTSVNWDNDWPWKPDVVFEGGNAGRDGDFASSFPSLSLLTTSHEPAQRLLTVSWATSAATALAANMAGQIMRTYPELWPETVRALMVHSARWTPAMLQAYCVGATRTQRTANLMRYCGYGVPDLSRALWSGRHALTLLVQDTLQPFTRQGSAAVQTQDMHLHDLPWPRDILLALGETPVKMRVTLSYFIEPNPGERGFQDKYSYQSHGLRFDVRRRAETDAVFRARINRLARDADYARANADQGWVLGDVQRRRGSLHADIWEGTAADLANRGQIAVYPSGGWWKTRPGHKRYNQPAHYALLIAIETPEIEQDIYAAVAAQIVPAVVEVGT